MPNNCLHNITASLLAIFIELINVAGDKRFCIGYNFKLVGCAQDLF